MLKLLHVCSICCKVIRDAILFRVSRVTSFEADRLRRSLHGTHAVCGVFGGISRLSIESEGGQATGALVST